LLKRQARFGGGYVAGNGNEGEEEKEKREGKRRERYPHF